MRRVGGIAKGGAVAGTARGSGARSATGFSLGGSAAAEAPSGVGAAAPVAAAGLSLLVAQENGGRSGRDAAARRRAAAMLDDLRGFQAELLGGQPDPARLARLAALEVGEEGADPTLREAVRAVALRARIEVARRGSG